MNKLKQILCLCILSAIFCVFTANTSIAQAQQKQADFSQQWNWGGNTHQATPSVQATQATPAAQAKASVSKSASPKADTPSVNITDKDYLKKTLEKNKTGQIDDSWIRPFGSKSTEEQNPQKTTETAGESGGYFSNLGSQMKSTMDNAVEKVNQCANAQKISGTDSLHPDAAGLFDNSILTEMQKMLHKLYKTFGLLFMVGHGLLCYATVGDGLLKLVSGAWVQILTFLPVPLFIPNWNLLFSGIFIYFFAMILAMAVGLYFVDISFKLGFAVLLLPVSIGLWPFKPTSRKLTENVSIIVRNAMLFTLMSIGLSFCIVLIMEGVFSGGVLNWEEFWEALETSNTGKMVENFSLFSMHTLVMAFCIIYGLKILASSIEDYLKYLFNDSIFGSESPIHHLSTQAVGMATNFAVKPVFKLAGDIAVHQTGNAIAAAGENFSKLGSREGRESLRQNFRRVFSRKAQQTINDADGSAGGGTTPPTTPITPVTSGDGTSTPPPPPAPEGETTPSTTETPNRQESQQQYNANASQSPQRNQEQVMPEERTAETETSSKAAKEKTDHMESIRPAHILDQAATGALQMSQYYTLKMAKALNIPFLNDIISYSNADNLVKSVRSISELQTQARANLQAMEDERHDKKESTAKFYLKKGGNVVLRTAKGAGEDSAKVFGGLLQGFGRALADSTKEKGKKQKKTFLQQICEKSAYQKYLEAQERKKQAKAEDSAYYSSLADQYDQ